jgi:SAM-dependent methyltransferase
MRQRMPASCGRLDRMTHDHEQVDVEAMFSQEFWDARYSAASALWSGQPNPRLVENVADRTPGAALDAGAGEGADAIWLATRRWQVTAVDVSPVALERAARHAEAAGNQVAARIRWQPADLRSWTPPAQQFDLVTAHYLHLPSSLRTSTHRRLAAAVRPGGMLLIVGHHPSDLQTNVARPNVPDLFFTGEEEAAALDPQDWTVVVSAPERQALDRDGRPATVSDAVLRAIRNP